MTTTPAHERARTTKTRDTGWDTGTRTRPRSGAGTERPVPRWAERVAHAIPLVLLPQCLWRLPFAFGFDMGTGTGSMGSPWVSIPYVFGLSLVTEGFALLGFGLVRGWGEVVPGWVPLLGGLRVRPAAALVPAVLGGTAATLLFGQFTLAALDIGLHFGDFDNGAWEVAGRACLLPAGLWGPMVLALSVHYFVRRRRTA
ncbi:hypothetical protein [Streptomyces aureocirculatus]|uniref:hypothetical protein n=1 Tax=Streptomyces aureocirculatus TaxID=67275 RepID=UPI000B1A8653|nr:hypothetical protein [Streptomyces aureocirculatus]